MEFGMGVICLEDASKELADLKCLYRPQDYTVSQPRRPKYEKL
jgi:hypothetical protein